MARRKLGILEGAVQASLSDPCPIRITPAEQRVLGLLRLGVSNRSIAAHLVVSPRTVESHVSHLLAKTGCRNRSQLLLWALARGEQG